jgi:hypothetical protein
VELTYVYLIDNVELGAAKAGIGGEDRLAVWRGRGWRLVACLTVADRERAEELENEVLTLVRESGYPPFLPVGFDGYSETFAGNGLGVAEAWFDERVDGGMSHPVSLGAVARVTAIAVVTVMTCAVVLTRVNGEFGFIIVLTAICCVVGFLLGRTSVRPDKRALVAIPQKPPKR